MATSSRKGFFELTLRVQAVFGLTTRKEAERVVTTIFQCLEGTLLDHLYDENFSLKLGSFGKFNVRHKPSICRRVGFSGETITTKPRRVVKFVSLGRLRRSEAVEVASELAR